MMVTTMANTPSEKASTRRLVGRSSSGRRFLMRTTSPSSSNGRLITFERLRDVDGTVMMELPPAVTIGSENTRCPEGEFKPRALADQCPAFPSNRDKAAAELVDRIV